MVAIFNYPSYLHQSRPEHPSPRRVVSRGCRLRHGGGTDLNSRPYLVMWISSNSRGRRTKAQTIQTLAATAAASPT